MKRQQEGIVEETVYKAIVMQKAKKSVVLYFTNLSLDVTEEGIYIGYEIVYPVSEYPQVKDFYSGITDKDFVIQERFIASAANHIELERLGTFKVLRPCKGEEYETYNNIESNDLWW